MSSSLDKLKALANRLEDKIEEKGKRIPAPSPTVQNVTPVVTKKVQTPVVKVKKQKSTSAALNCENVREDNIARVNTLYEKLKIFEKSPDFDEIFAYKAMNLSGIGLKENDFGQVREGKYIQVIAITYEPDKNGKKKAKNISLGYFGKAETLDGVLKNEIIEFVLRWRYEKAFQNVEHYKDLLEILNVPVNTPMDEDETDIEKKANTLF